MLKTSIRVALASALIVGSTGFAHALISVNGPSKNGLTPNGWMNSGSYNALTSNGGGTNGGGTNGASNGLSSFAIDGIELARN